jgi:murein DD-endopeptidase MepM/ murein hydrolase activator NlpD
MSSRGLFGLHTDRRPGNHIPDPDRRRAVPECLAWYALFGVVVWMMLGSGTPESQATYVASPGPAAYPEDHFWLSTPVGEGAVGIVPDRFYPYGSTGQGRYQVHHGVEYANPTGTPVLAAAEGTVVVAGSDEVELWGRHLGYYGQLVVVRLAQRYGDAPVYTLYGHLSRVYVRLGQRVRRGEAIGAVGMSGVALGPHLHFEVRVGYNDFEHTRNPELWLEPQGGRGTIAGRIEDANGRPVPEALVTFHPVERPDRYWREAWTYHAAPLEKINPDDVWRENLTMGDVPAGEYVVRTRIEGRLYVRQVQVEAGEMTWVVIRARTTDESLNPKGSLRMEP